MAIVLVSAKMYKVTVYYINFNIILNEGRNLTIIV